MIKRRDFLKAAALAAGSGLLKPWRSPAAQQPSAGAPRMDFETYLPRVFDGKPFGPEDLEALEDEAAVGRFVVFPETTGRPDNAGLAARIKSHPRMIGGASVNPTLGAEAVTELERSVKDLGLRGVRLSPALHNYPFVLALVSPLLEKARDLGVPVTVDGDTDNCRPDQLRAAASRFPELTIIADMGFRAPVRPPGEPAGREMREVVCQCPNIFFGLTALTTCQPSYLMSTIWTGGAERVVFGSNAPFSIPLFAVKGVEWARVGSNAEALIFHDNLKKLYKLDS
jgi:predicted TIM-barrel fold metal-dependent hydrolase